MTPDELSNALSKLPDEIKIQLLSQGAEATKKRVQDNIRGRTRRWTGALHDTVTTIVTPNSAVIGSPMNYAIYQELGVRPFGPVRAHALRWRSYGGGVVFSMHSSGFPAKNIFLDAANALTANDFGDRMI